MPSELVVVSHKYPPYAGGGLAPFVERFLAALRARRTDLPVVLHTMNVPGGLPRTTVLDDGLRVERHRLPGLLRRNFLAPRHAFERTGRLWFGAALAWFNLSVAVALARRTHRRGTTVDVHEWQSTPVGLFAARMLGLAVVYHVHSTEQTMTGAGRDPLGLIRRFEQAMARHARAVVVATPEMRELVVEHGFPADKVHVVTYGHDDPVAAGLVPASPEARRSGAERLRAELGLPADAPVVLFAGRLSAVKGIGTLLHAVPGVLAAHPTAQLLVVGVGFPGTGESAAVHRTVDELGLGASVRVYDDYLPQAELARHYDLADVCVFPSTFEPFGLVSVEAMAHGRPTVLGPAFSRVITHDDSGPVVLQSRRDDSRELAALLLRVLDDPAGAAELAERGRRHVERTFSWDEFVDDVVGLCPTTERPAPQEVSAC